MNINIVLRLETKIYVPSFAALMATRAITYPKKKPAYHIISIEHSGGRIHETNFLRPFIT